MLSEGRIEELATKAVDGMEGATWSAMRKEMITAIRTAAKESAEAQIRKDAEICAASEWAAHARDHILSQLPKEAKK